MNAKTTMDPLLLPVYKFAAPSAEYDPLVPHPNFKLRNGNYIIPGTNESMKCALGCPSYLDLIPSVHLPFLPPFSKHPTSTLRLHSTSDLCTNVNNLTPSLQLRIPEDIQPFDTDFSASNRPTIVFPYDPPERYGKRTSMGGIRWEVNVHEPNMQERAEFLMTLDPMLPPEDAAWHVNARYGNFLCRECGKPMVFNGQNGAGTTKCLCKSCKTSPSIWNTFEMTVWKYKKLINAAMLSNYGVSVDLASEIFGVGKGALNEMRMSLPNTEYSKTGEPMTIEYEDEKFTILFQDMIYIGKEGMMLGVSGGLEATSLGDEKTGKGLDEFYDRIEQHMKTERFVLIMDMRLNVIKKILERFKERVTIVAQNHSTWGDVLAYFYHDDEWHTLRIRTDAFTSPSPKRDEDRLLAMGDIEIYKGLKGVSPNISLKDLTEACLKRKIDELLNYIRNTDWTLEGRIDLVMRAKIKKLNSLFRELERRGCDVIDITASIRVIIGGLSDQYASIINRMVKKKIVSAWRVLTILKDEINMLSEKLLKEPLPEKKRETDENGLKKKKNKSEVKFLTKPELIYHGQMDAEEVPESGKWIIELLRQIFNGKEITTNICEGRFGVIGRKLRQGRAIYLERAVTKIHLQTQGVTGNLEWLIESYPIQDMGRRGVRLSRTRILDGGQYLITYVNRHKERSERVIDVISSKKKRIDAYCHNRDEILTFKRRRMENITMLRPPSPEKTA